MKEWILFAVIAGGTPGLDLTVMLERFKTYNECDLAAQYMTTETRMNKDLSQQYDFYCVKDTTLRV